MNKTSQLILQANDLEVANKYLRIVQTTLSKNGLLPGVRVDINNLIKKVSDEKSRFEKLLDAEIRRVN